METVYKRGYIEKTSTCWLWKGTKDKQGYGSLMVDRKRSRAHRYVYERIVGKIPEGFQIDHLCRNTSCVNPEHLEAVPPFINYWRGASICARNKFKKTCDNGHAFTPENTYYYKCKSRKTIRLWRSCRECRRKTCRDRARKLRAELKNSRISQ